MDRQTVTRIRQTDRQSRDIVTVADRLADRQTQTDRQTDRQTRTDRPPWADRLGVTTRIQVERQSLP